MEKVILNTAAFIPFSTGTRSCPGKNLAMMEMRIVACHIVQRFDMQLDPGHDLDNWENDLEDLFVFKKGDLPVVLTERR
jgi:cytochrome P450